MRATLGLKNQRSPMPTPASPQKRQEWEEKIHQQKESGQSIVRWCEQNNISYHTFNYWRERLGYMQPLKATSFKELTDTSSDSGICIEKKGLRIHVSKNFDLSTLSQCLKALDKLC